MWRKSYTTTGKMVLTKRTLTENDILETAFWFDPSDADFAQAEEWAKKMGL